MRIAYRAVEGVERVLVRVGTTPADAALALGATALALVDMTGDQVISPFFAVPIAVPAVLALAWRRRSPVLVAAAVCTADLVLSVTAPGPFPPQLMLVAVLISVYTVAAYTEGRASAVGAVITLPLIVVAHVVTGDGDPGDFLPWLVWGAPWGVGKVVRRRTLEASRVAVEAMRSPEFSGQLFDGRLMLRAVGSGTRRGPLMGSCRRVPSGDVYDYRTSQCISQRLVEPPIV